MTATITPDLAIPPRSRTFTEEDAKTILGYLNEDRNCGYGTFTSGAAARSAGVALNRMLTAVGATQKYATSVVKRSDTEYVGVVLPKAAKVVERKPNGKGKGKGKS